MEAQTRQAALQRAIADCKGKGWRLENVTGDSAVMTSGGMAPQMHVIHGILTLVTCGAWAIGWLLFAVVYAKKKRLVITVDEASNISYLQ